MNAASRPTNSWHCCQCVGKGTTWHYSVIHTPIYSPIGPSSPHPVIQYCDRCHCPQIYVSPVRLEGVAENAGRGNDGPSSRAWSSVIFVFCIFMPRDFDGPSFSDPAFSVASGRPRLEFVSTIPALSPSFPCDFHAYYWVLTTISCRFLRRNSTMGIGFLAHHYLSVLDRLTRWGDSAKEEMNAATCK